MLLALAALVLGFLTAPVWLAVAESLDPFTAGALALGLIGIALWHRLAAAGVALVLLGAALAFGACAATSCIS